jgi:outer membrane protein, heavy metal efflux system
MHFPVRTCGIALALAHVLLCQTRLTLADAVSRALASNPRVAAAEARVRAAEGLQRQAGLSPNPRVIVQVENTRFWESPSFSYPQDTETYAFLAQVFETGGKRDRRVEFAAENVRISELEAQLERRGIAVRVSSAYWAAAGAVQVRDLLQEEIASFNRVVQLNRDRVQEGVLPEVDLLRTEVERDRLVGLATAASQEAERARIALFREMGQQEFPAVEYADSIEEARPPAPLAVGEVLERRVEMTMAREAVAQARANLRLQQANAKPDPDIHLGYERFGEFDTLYAAAQIPLPIRNRNQGEIAAAASEIRAAEASVAATDATIRAELESAKTDYEFHLRLVNETLRPMRERADEVYRIMDAAYRETGSDILRLLDAERAKIEADVAYARALAELQQSAVALQAAQGGIP